MSLYCREERHSNRLFWSAGWPKEDLRNWLKTRTILSSSSVTTEEASTTTKTEAYKKISLSVHDHVFTFIKENGRSPLGYFESAVAADFVPEQL